MQWKADQKTVHRCGESLPAAVPRLDGKAEKALRKAPHTGLSAELLVLSFSSSEPQSSALVTQYCHLMTLSALVSTRCGIVTPICFAVLRLITSSILSTVSTGRSLGLMPERMRWTYFADVRPAP